MPTARTWNWQQKDWPEFRYNSAKLEALEAEFLHQSGVFMGAIRHVDEDDNHQLCVELISNEALNTSEIEGEILNRDSLQSSFAGRRFFLLRNSGSSPKINSQCFVAKMTKQVTGRKPTLLHGTKKH